MKGSLKIGRIAGVNLFIHWTFLFLIAYVIVTNYRAGHNTEQTIWSLIFILSIFITVILHELGHAIAAQRFGIKTQDITLLPIGGIARLETIPEKPKEEFIVAIAGPLVNVILALITRIFITIPDTDQLTLETEGGVNAGNFFLFFFVVNVWLAVFNMIPAFPMDGGRVLRALLAIRLERSLATKIAARIGQILAVGFIILGFYYNPFLIIIGIFIMFGAQAEAEYTQTKFMLKDYKVRDVLMKSYQSIESRDTIKTAVDFLLNSQNKNFLVTEDDVPVGTLSRDEIIKALSEKGESEKIKNAMNPEVIFLDADSSLEMAFQKSQQNGSNLMPVLEKKRIIGTIDMENILEFILIMDAKKKKN